MIKYLWRTEFEVSDDDFDTLDECMENARQDYETNPCEHSIYQYDTNDYNEDEDTCLEDIAEYSGYFIGGEDED